jgi:hypothetical protein
MDGNDVIFMRAVELGCNPQWLDGLFGWTWHCGCPDLRHACDSQCSMIMAHSLERKLLRA